ncbi:MAG: ATP-grasp domain-containing protein [Rivularia sp. (in: Bacteria)]|nr:ATP-grasp domain-containing protein [Rivularia sp. MS3]
MPTLILTPRYSEDSQILWRVAILSDNRVEIPSATVIDVGVIKGRGWAVVEQNAAWGAGLYGCNPT